jgi:hypothetical protein
MNESESESRERRNNTRANIFIHNEQDVQNGTTNTVSGCQLLQCRACVCKEERAEPLENGANKEREQGHKTKET